MTASDALPIQFWDIDDETFNEKEVCSITRACFCQPFNASDTIWFIFGGVTAFPIYVRAYDAQNNYLGQLEMADEYASIVPSEDFEELVDKQVYFVVRDNSNTPVLKSDCILVKNSHECTTLIRYSNSKDFAGIDYDISPTPELQIRVPAIFFQDRFPDEHEELDLSNSRIVRLTNQLKEQRLLDVGFMPFYMHKKLQLVLMHDTITIDGGSWLRTEPYELADGNKRYPLRKSQVWLTNKNYIVRNIL